MGMDISFMQAPQAQLSATASAYAAPTTVMLRGIPLNYTREKLILDMYLEGFDESTHNMVHLVPDEENGCNKGYAHINFVCHQEALRFRERFQGYCNWKNSRSRKTCTTDWS